MSAAPSNLVRLPTAAPRKVRQRLSATKAADRKALLRFPDIYRTTQERRAQQLAEEIRELQRSPELALGLALFQVLTDEKEKVRVQGTLAALAAMHPTSGIRGVLAYLEFVTGSPSKRAAIKRELERLSGEDE